jgi:transposase
VTQAQTWKKKYEDQKTVNVNLRAKYGDGYAEAVRNAEWLLGENVRLASLAERLRKECSSLKRELGNVGRIRELREETRTPETENARLTAELEKANDRLTLLMNGLKKDSSVSDRPSSSNPFRKTVSSRAKTGRKPGGQPGHGGRTAQPCPNPARIDDRLPESVCACGGAVKPCGKYTAKQKIGIEVHLAVTEERSHAGYCEKCGKRHDGGFSKGFVNPVQYDVSVKTFVSYLNSYANMPANKITCFLRDVTGGALRMSDGTVVNIVSELSARLDKSVEDIKKILIARDVLHCDETGCRVSGKLDWFQIFADGLHTLYSHNKKRGDLGFEGADILSLFIGVLVHDHPESYYGYGNFSNAECNEHIKRYLKGIDEILGHGWAKEMKKFLTDTDNRKKELIAVGSCFGESDPEDIFDEYTRILDAGDAEYRAATDGKTNITMYNDERCLLKRLREYMDEHLRFAGNPAVPFGNNCAEQAAKEIKRKQKVSGCSGSDRGADSHARCLSVFASLRKQNRDVFVAVRSAFDGRPPRFPDPGQESGPKPDTG